MTAKEKAIELVNRFKKSAFTVRDYEAKDNALICVDEITKAIQYREPGDFEFTGIEYWQEVKQEIKKL